MKKSNLFLFALFINLSVLVSAQDASVAEAPQKPSIEDFFHTWTLEKCFYLKTNSRTNKIEKVEVKIDFSYNINYLNESFFVVSIKPGIKYGLFTSTTELNYTISNWEEAANTFTDVEEFPFGFKVYSIDLKEGKTSESYIFMNSDRKKYISLSDVKGTTELAIFKKNK